MTVTQDWESYLVTLQHWAERSGSLPSVELEVPVQPQQPLPQESAGQARHMLGLLQAAAERTRAAQREVGQQLSALNRMPELDVDHSRYVDTTG